MRSLFFTTVALAAACGDSGPRPDASVAPQDHAYALGSFVFGTDSTTSYVNVLGSLDAQTLDYGKAREFGDMADIWAYDGSVFVAAASDDTITRYSVENGQLVERGKLSLANYGPAEVGFWRNTFISPTKAYFLNGASDFIIWNPSTMTITGTLALPPLEARDGFMVYPGYSDRSAVIRDGKLYQPLYWTDSSYFQMSPDSRIAVFDVETDTLVDTLVAPCPGLDYATADDAGNLYFSSWIYAAGGALVLHQPDTCVVKLPAGGAAPTVAFNFKDVAGGRQGAALRFIGHGKALMSVLHGEHTTIDDTTDAGTVTYADNWRFWLYDFATGTAEQLDAFDWNDGGQYSFTIDGETYTLLSKSDYSSTSVYDLGDGSAPRHLFDTMGWSTRLFQVR
jgi:hypothetical protein